MPVRRRSGRASPGRSRSAPRRSARPRRRASRSEEAREDRLQRLLDMLVQIDAGTGALQLDHEPAVGRAMQQPVEFRGRIADPAAHRERDRVQRSSEGAARCASARSPSSSVERPLQHAAVEVEECGRVGARLDRRRDRARAPRAARRAAGSSPARWICSRSQFERSACPNGGGEAKRNVILRSPRRNVHL